MTELILFPDVEALIISYFNTELPAYGIDAKSFSAVPENRPDAFFRVMRTGGPATDFFIDTAQMTIESWAEDEDVAYNNGKYARALLHRALSDGVMDGVAIYDVKEFVGFQNLPDPTSAQIRYTATIAVSVRGTAA